MLSVTEGISEIREGFKKLNLSDDSLNDLLDNNSSYESFTAIALGFDKKDAKTLLFVLISKHNSINRLLVSTEVVEILEYVKVNISPIAAIKAATEFMKSMSKNVDAFKETINSGHTIIKGKMPEPTLQSDKLEYKYDMKAIEELAANLSEKEFTTVAAAMCNVLDLAIYAIKKKKPEEETIFCCIARLGRSVDDISKLKAIHIKSYTPDALYKAVMNNDDISSSQQDRFNSEFNKQFNK